MLLNCVTSLSHVYLSVHLCVCLSVYLSVFLSVIQGDCLHNCSTNPMHTLPYYNLVCETPQRHMVQHMPGTFYGAGTPNCL